MPNPQSADTLPLDPDTLDLLSQASTATVATLLYKRGYHNAYEDKDPLPADMGKDAGSRVPDFHTVNWSSPLKVVHQLG